MLHPLSRFLASWFADGEADIASLNASALERGLISGGQVAIHFEQGQALAGVEYEETTFLTGRVLTRPVSPHDLFNALIWLSFPQAKAEINKRHVEALRAAQSASPHVATKGRGAVRDALTQFDECGVVIAGTDAEVWTQLQSHQWRELFVAGRERLLASTEFVVFGHASHDALRAPYVGLCGKAVFIKVDEAELAAARRGEFAELDRRLAAVFAQNDLSPRDWQPLPLLGIPGATVDNERPEYYSDTRQFRPKRTIRAGSSLGSR